MATPTKRSPLLRVILGKQDIRSQKPESESTYLAAHHAHSRYSCSDVVPRKLARLGTATIQHQACTVIENIYIVHASHIRV